MTDTKRCTKCGETKPVDEFYRNRSHRDGLNSYCKECRRAYYEAHREEKLAYQRAYYETHREERLAMDRAYYEAHREEKLAYKRESRALLGDPHGDRWQEITRKHATRSGRWSEAEDKYLATSTDRTIDDALALGRTHQSVKERLRRLRKRGVPIARDMATV